MASIESSTATMSSALYVSAPGKVILHGEHAVVYGKTALASSLNLRTFLKLTHAVHGDTASFNLPDIGLKRVWMVTELMEAFMDCLGREARHDIGPPTALKLGKMKEFTNISDEGSTKDLAVLAVLYLYLSILGSGNNPHLPSVVVHLTSDLPTGAGLGSSAAFAVCLSSAFLTQAGLITPLEENKSKSPSWKKVDLDVINHWAFEAERIIHGNPSGIDNAVSTYGGALCYQGKHIMPLASVPVLRIILINTRIPRSTKVLVAGVREKYEKYPAVIGPVLDSIDGISQICQSVFEQLVNIQSDPMKHNADQSSTKASKPIRVQNTTQPDRSSPLYDTLEELIDMNQQLLEVIGVSHPTLEKLCTITSKYGLHSKLTGAGGGGCTLTLMRPDTVSDTVVQVKEDVVALGFDLWETSIGGVGVAFHSDLKQAIEMDLMFQTDYYLNCKNK